MQETTLTFIITILACIISALCTYYFTTRNLDQKMNVISEENTKKAITTHLEIKHQDSLYDYVEGQMDKHKEGCGIILTTSLSAVQTKLQHMELKEMKRDITLQGVAAMVKSIAKKMKIDDIPELNTDTRDGD